MCRSGILPDLPGERQKVAFVSVSSWRKATFCIDEPCVVSDVPVRLTEDIQNTACPRPETVGPRLGLYGYHPVKVAFVSVSSWRKATFCIDEPCVSRTSLSDSQRTYKTPPVPDQRRSGHA